MVCVMGGGGIVICIAVLLCCVCVIVCFCFFVFVFVLCLCFVTMSLCDMVFGENMDTYVIVMFIVCQNKIKKCEL